MSVVEARGAKYFPSEGGITYRGVTYYPADYVFTSARNASALAAHDRRVVAKALTDAADEMREILRFRTLGGPSDEWLRERAAAITQ